MKNIFYRYIISLIILLLILPVSLKSQDSFETNLFTADDTVKSLKFLSARISKAIMSANFKNTKYAVAVYSLDNKQYYFKKSTNKPLTPASLTKLFTCYTALKTLGTDFEYKTEVYHTGQFKNGVITGDIYIVGSGDPLFSTNDIKTIVDTMKSMGVQEVKGNIIADGSFFDDITDRVAYSGDKDRVQPVPKISGLSINKNIVTVTLHGIPQGKYRRGLITTDPPSPAFGIINKSKVKGRSKKSKSKTKSKRSYLDNNEINFYGGPVSNMSVTRKRTYYIKQKKDANGRQIFVASGTIGADKSYSYRYFIMQPELVVAGALLRLLNQAGIKVVGTYKTGILRDVATPIYKITDIRRKLVDVISPTLKNSDNYLAENIFKLIGAHSGKMVENAKESRQIIMNLMDSLNMDFEKCVLYDGSGLSRRNKITAGAGVELLKIIYNSQNIKTVIDTSLAIAGTSGTLKKRMRHTLAEGNLKAKTGTHKNVSGLCGVVKTLDGERLAFCFIFNGPSVGLYKQVENKLGIILAEFFYFNKEG